ncbi:MAG TPA: alpha/beta hydrolase [Candidatus Dormibacteraeota bacterium]|nr:alpha/beta hydrolase [Candidatus Dormibacteraeota bacterium]
MQRAGQEGWIERDGVRLHWLEWRPEGPVREPALFLLHGLSSNARVWERMAAHLPGRRIVALDQRSHGRSDRPATGYAGEELVADAVHAIRELDLGRPLVAGHSWGAGVALGLASEHPELAAGLVFVDGPTVSFSRLMSWEDAAQRMQPPLPVYPDLDAATAAQRQYLGDAYADDLREFVRAGLVEVEGGGLASTLTADVRLQILRDLYDGQPELLFANVEGPILLAMAGQLWPGAPREFAERRRRGAEEVVELRPDAQVRWYESRHDVPLIRPAELSADVERTAIAAEFRSLARDAAALAARGRHDWTTHVGGDSGDWNAREVLAHLSSTQASLAGVIEAPPPAPADGERPPFDPDRWNAAMLRRRQDKTPAQLADEMRVGAEQIHAALLSADLSRPAATGSFAGVQLDEAMEGMLDHQRAHMAALRQALGA